MSDIDEDDWLDAFGGLSVYQAIVPDDVPLLLPGEDWAWRRPDFLHAPVRFSLYNRKISLAKLFSKIISDDQLSNVFAGCCFGSYLAMDNTGASSAQAFSFMIYREIVCRGSTDDELWFRVGVSNIRFGPDDFALATGLKFGTPTCDLSDPLPAPVLGIKYRLYGNRRPNMRDLMDNFLSDKVGKIRLELVDKLKLGKILFLYLQLLGSDAHNCLCTIASLSTRVYLKWLCTSMEY